MSSPTPPTVIQYQAPRRTGGRIILVLLLLGSLALNAILCAGLSVGQFAGLDVGERLRERHRAGPQLASDKIAIVRLDGAILEGLLDYLYKQIESAAGDNAVKAVVFHVESPGGSITASDEVLRRMEQLRDGTTLRYKGRSIPKPVVVSMGSVAASGGYYVSMVAQSGPKAAQSKAIFAERTTITGSIGVYASLPNAKAMADKVGFKMELIKAGDIKASGSPFHDMTPVERQPWQDMVDGAYRTFIDVVETGRPALKGKLTEPLFPERAVGRFDDKGVRIGESDAKYTRKLADGGIFTAKEALDHGLIDAIGSLDDAVAEAASQAGLTDFRVVVYEKPQTLFGALTGAQAIAPAALPGWADLTPRLWFLMPDAEIAARLSRP